MHIDTPLLDAALFSLAPIEKNRRYSRFINAKADIAQGIEKQHIWNVDYVAAKGDLNDGVREALDTLMPAMREVFWKARGTKASSPKWDDAQKVMKAYDQVSSYIQLNHCAGKVKLLNKAAIPEFAPYIAMIEEAAYLHTMAEQARKFKVMGRKPAENPTPVDITNTAHCGICGNRQKMTAAEKMVHHGFQITYMGRPLYRRLGSCFGVGYAPIEISCEANLAYVPALQKRIADTNEFIARLKADGFDSHVEVLKRIEYRRVVEYTVTHAKGTEKYDQLRDRLIYTSEWEVRALESEVEVRQRVIAQWKPSKFDWKVE